MWVENMSLDEIKEILLKDNPFGKLLQILGEINFDNPKESTSMKEDKARHLMNAVINDIVLPKVQETSACPVRRVRSKQGDGSMPYLREATRSIYVTHFRPETYPNDYIALQLEKIRAGLRFERLVFEHSQYPAAYQWLERFFDADHKPLRGYRQYKLEWDSPTKLNDPLGLPLPFDFMIIDEQRVLLWITIHRQGACWTEELLVVESQELAREFLDTWKNWTPNQREAHKRTTQVISHTPGPQPPRPRGVYASRS